MEPIKDPKDNSKKSTNLQHMVRTDFKEQKLEKFFVDKNPVKTVCKALDTSLTQEEYERAHNQFLENVENLEDIMNKTEDKINITENNKINIDKGETM